MTGQHKPVGLGELAAETLDLAGQLARAAIVLPLLGLGSLLSRRRGSERGAACEPESAAPERPGGAAPAEAGEEGPSRSDVEAALARLATATLPNPARRTRARKPATGKGGGRATIGQTLVETRPHDQSGDPVDS